MNLSQQQPVQPSPGPVMLDIAGAQLAPADLRRLKHPLTGGVILFERNFVSRTQLTALTSAIHAVRPDIVIAVDHEGGRVQRFASDGFTRLPAMRRLGEQWERNREFALRAADALGFVLAAELRACGVDLSFTPVLDLDHGTSAVIGDRAFHRDPGVVAQLAAALNAGLARAGMANCGKHFPGHGYAEADSHVAVPIDTRTLQQMRDDDLAPYGWVGVGLAGVMPAHVVYPEVDSLPAGFSHRWLSILRDDLRFDGVIFSDDLSMEGASVAGDVVCGARAALEAGCDMVLICNAPALADQLLSGLERDELPSRAIATERIVRLLPQMPAPDWSQLQTDRDYLNARECVALLSTT